MNRRISRGTPYILTATEIDETLKHLPPRVELALAAMLNLKVDEWRKLPGKVRAKHIIDHQNAGAFAATMVAAERAITDLEASALPAAVPTAPVVEEIADAVIEAITRRGMLVVNPTTTTKKSA